MIICVHGWQKTWGGRGQKKKTFCLQLAESTKIAVKPDQKNQSQIPIPNTSSASFKNDRTKTLDHEHSEVAEEL